MGIVVSSRNFSPQRTEGLLKPIFYCCAYPAIRSQAVSIEKALAEELIRFSPKRRSFQLERCLDNVLAELPPDAVIRDFDVLFHPAYQVDILKVIVNACKKRPFSVIWPGRMVDKKLVYAEEGYRDYKEYDVDAYDITCVI